ncbi:hypothetical protein V6N12_007910 [Hibiscus sabdariffa]
MAQARLQHEIEEAERQLLKIEYDVQDLQHKAECKIQEAMSKFGQPGRIAYLERQQAPVEAGVDMEMEAVTIKRLIKLLHDEKPARFSSQMLQSFTSNYSTKLVATARMKVSRSSSWLKSTHHRNLVRLYGFCFQAKKKALVYEFMENGSLDKLLFENKHEIEWDKLYEIAVGVARDLHHFTLKEIIHYDIKPANVLLASESDYCPKVVDFGLAKLCNRDTTNITMSRVGGTPGYAAPEIWMPFPVSYKCDVYSFGVMLFEMVGRRRNFVGQGKGQDNGECVQYLPDARPSMRDVVKILEGGAEAATPPNHFST